MSIMQWIYQTESEKQRVKITEFSKFLKKIKEINTSIIETNAKVPTNKGRSSNNIHMWHQHSSQIFLVLPQRSRGARQAAAIILHSSYCRISARKQCFSSSPGIAWVKFPPGWNINHTTQISGTQNYLHWEDTGILGAQSSENHDLNHSDFSWRENTMLGINKSEYGTIIVYKTCTCPHKIWHSSWMGDSRA